MFINREWCFFVGRFFAIMAHRLLADTLLFSNEVGMPGRAF